MKSKYFFCGLVAMLALVLTSVACSDDDDVVTPAPTPEREDPVLTIDSHSIDVPETGGKYSVRFDLEHPISGESVTASNSEDWISDLNVKMEDETFGFVSFEVALNEQEAPRSAKITLAYKAAESVNFTVRQAAKTPEKPVEGEAPEISLELHYEPAAEAVAVDMRCSTANATDAAFACVPVKALDEIMQNQGVSLEQFLTPEYGVATQFNSEMLDILNGEGFLNEIIAYRTPQLAGLELIGILQAKNEFGQTLLQSKTFVDDIQTPEPPVPGVGPELEFEIYRGESGEVIYYACSPSQNVASGEIVTDSKALFDEMFSRFGDDLETLADAAEGQGQQLSQERILQVNSVEGLELSVKNPNPNVVYAGLMIVYDTEHHRTVSYAHEPVAPEPEPEPQHGNLQVNFEVIAETNGFTVCASCPTHNAEQAWIIWTDPLELNSIVSGGKTLEDVMDKAIVDKGSGRAQKYETKWINEMNTDVSELFLGGSAGTSYAFVIDVRNSEDRVVKRDDALIEEYSGPSYVQELSDDDFCQLVWDYNLSKDFQFRGQRPCIIDFGAPAWCGWCVELIPVMMQASVDYKDQVDFYSLDTDIYAEAYEAMVAQLNAGNSIPLLIMVDKLGRCQIIGGYITLDEMHSYIDMMLATEAVPAKAAPVIKLDAYRTPEDRAVFLNYCTSEDAYSAELVYSPLSDFNSWFETYDMESLADALKGCGMQFSSDWLMRFNSPNGVGVQVRAAVGDTYAAMLIAYNSKGRSIAYAVAEEVRATSSRPMSVSSQHKSLKQMSIEARPSNLLDARRAFHIAPMRAGQREWIEVGFGSGFHPVLKNIARFNR